MITIKELYDSFTQSLGVEGSKKLIDETIKKVGLLAKKEYSREEVIKICDKLKQEKGFVKTIAGFVAGRAMLEKSEKEH